MADENGKLTLSWIVGQVTSGVVVAVVLSAAALIWNAASNGQIIRLMGGVTEEDGVTKKELRTALSSVLSGVIAQRFGAKGPVGSVEGQDPFDYTAANNGDFVASRKEYPICAVTTVTIAATPTGQFPGYCTLLSPQDLWKIYVSGSVGCIVTCFK
jgi:hypothetical protein